jgi:hypothetical protein
MFNFLLFKEMGDWSIGSRVPFGFFCFILFYLMEGRMNHRIFISLVMFLFSFFFFLNKKEIKALDLATHCLCFIFI